MLRREFLATLSIPIFSNFQHGNKEKLQTNSKQCVLDIISEQIKSRIKLLAIANENKSIDIEVEYFRGSIGCTIYLDKKAHLGIFEKYSKSSDGFDIRLAQNLLCMAITELRSHYSNVKSVQLHSANDAIEQ